MKIKYSNFLILILLFTQYYSYSQSENFNDSARHYYGLNNLPKAIFWSEKNVNFQKEKYGITDTLYGKAVNDLGVYYFFSGNYQSAKNMFLQSIEILKNVFGEKNADYISNVGNLGNVYQRLGQYEEAENYLLKNIDLLEKASLTKTNDYPQSFNNIAWLYNILSRYTEGETMYLKALAIYKELSGMENVNYARTLDNLGSLYLNTGKYAICEKMYQQSLSIRKRVLGEKDWQYGASVSNLGSLNQALGNYTVAESYFKLAVDIVKKQLGEKHPQYSIGIGNLSILYLKNGDYINAEKFAKKSVEILDSTSGRNSLSFCKAINNLGSIYYLQGAIEKAEIIFKEVQAICKKLHLEFTNEYSTSLTNYGKCLLSKNDFINADSSFTKALLIKEDILQTNQIEYIDILNNKVIMYCLQNDYLNANKFLQKSVEQERLQLLSKIDFLSEIELLSYLKVRADFISLPHSFLLHSFNNDIVKVSYNSKLFYNSIAQQNTSNFLLNIGNSRNSSIINFWNTYKNNKLFLNKLLSQPSTKRLINTDSLSNICNQQEKELLRNSAEYRGMREKLNTTWQDVRSNLKQSEAAIEFIKFNNLKRKSTASDTIYYAAMLLRPEDTIPVFIKLFEESELKTALKSFAYKTPALNRGIKISAKSNDTKNIKSNIYILVWQPLEPYLTNTKTIYFAPDGLLHQLAFAAIPYKNNLLLCDKYNLIQLTSTRQIAIKENENIIPSSIALFGGINYNRQNTDTSIAVSADPYAYVYQQNRSAGVDSFAYLPNTLKEIEGIKKSMQLKQKKISFYTGDKATEAAFRNIGGNTSPAVIHFATHGFTLPDTATQKNSSTTFKVSDNPLLRSGLVLAGGNKGWMGKSNLDEDDGILTALEISSVPLQNTQLAVLSACETGTGELRGSEGVFGLQRAFKLAGVNYVMASLWQVPDKETGEFMNTFYSNWLGGKTIRQAFITTQQTMRKKYAPYYWAAFTLVQ
jgi:CHAT domain-containing protein/Tfp pilus assembly protein PilF